MIWLIAPGLVLVGAPFVARLLVRTTREAVAAEAALRTLAGDLRTASEGLRAASGAFASSLRAFQDDLTR